MDTRNARVMGALQPRLATTGASGRSSHPREASASYLYVVGVVPLQHGYECPRPGKPKPMKVPSER